MPKQNPTPTLACTASHHFHTSVNNLWSAWTGGLLNDQRAFTGIREALTELEEDRPAADAQFGAFHTAVTSATEDWEKGRLDEEDAMVRILDALLALDTTTETTGASR